MIIYQPDRIHYSGIKSSDDLTEFEIQAILYNRLTAADFLVRGETTTNRGRLDLVVFAGSDGSSRDVYGEAAVVIEVKPHKCPDGAEEQCKKYTTLGLPVVLFWDLKDYDELEALLKIEVKKRLKDVRESKLKPVEEWVGIAPLNSPTKEKSRRKPRVKIDLNNAHNAQELHQIKFKILQDTLNKVDGNRAEAARILGVPVRTIYKWLKQKDFETSSLKTEIELSLKA